MTGSLRNVPDFTLLLRSQVLCEHCWHSWNNRKVLMTAISDNFFQLSNFVCKSYCVIFPGHLLQSLATLNFITKVKFNKMLIYCLTLTLTHVFMVLLYCSLYAGKRMVLMLLLNNSFFHIFPFLVFLQLKLLNCPWFTMLSCLLPVSTHQISVPVSIHHCKTMTCIHIIYTLSIDVSLCLFWNTCLTSAKDLVYTENSFKKKFLLCMYNP